MHRLLLALLLLTIALPAPVQARQPHMGRYVLGLLWRGDQWTPERNARTDSLQAGHMANMQRRYEEGWLVGAGPVLDPASSLRGLFIFKADSVAQVIPLVATDPAIASGRLRIDLYSWWSRPGIGEDYKRARRANPAMKDSMVRYVLGLVEPSRTKGESMFGGTRMILSGTWLDERHRELVVFDTADTAQARSWASSDPRVRDGSVRVELRPWMVARGVIPGH